MEDLFNELLEQWYWAEHTAIMNMSGNFIEETKELDKEKEDYMKRFKELFNSQSEQTENNLN